MQGHAGRFTDLANQIRKANKVPRKLRDPRLVWNRISHATLSATGGAQNREQLNHFIAEIREFNRLIVTIRSQDLTPGDWAGLRGLLRELLLLTRARHAQAAVIVAPLPQLSTSARGRRRASRIH
jgi:hypothetical protein